MNHVEMTEVSDGTTIGKNDGNIENNESNETGRAEMVERTNDAMMSDEVDENDGNGETGETGGVAMTEATNETMMTDETDEAETAKGTNHATMADETYTTETAARCSTAPLSPPVLPRKGLPIPLASSSSPPRGEQTGQACRHPEFPQRPAYRRQEARSGHQIRRRTSARSYSSPGSPPAANPTYRRTHR